MQPSQENESDFAAESNFISVIVERYNERLKRFDRYRRSRRILRRLLTDLELPFIEFIYDNSLAMQSLYLRSAKITVF